MMSARYCFVVIEMCALVKLEFPLITCSLGLVVTSSVKMYDAQGPEADPLLLPLRIFARYNLTPSCMFPKRILFQPHL
jgi:hypothetical protein